MEMAVTATSLRGVCKGPTHCCCAINPVTHLSTLFVKNLLLHTVGNRNTLSRTDITVKLIGKWNVFNITGFRSKWKTCRNYKFVIISLLSHT